jgi:hypothetical protein
MIRKGTFMVRLLCSMLVMLGLASASTRAEDDQAKPNELTRQEIADGWISLFDGATTFGWKIDGEAKVEKGWLVLGGTKATRAETTTSLQRIRYGLDLELVWETGKEAPTFSAYVDKCKMLSSPKWARITVEDLNMETSGGHGSYGDWHWPDSLTEKKGSPTPKRQLFNVPAGSRLKVRNVKYRSYRLQPIFNGKNLSNWKRIGDEKAKVFISQEGSLNIQGGPMVLQSAVEWGNGMFQFDARTQGKHARSAVFFRSLRDQPRTGYYTQFWGEGEGVHRSNSINYGTGGIANHQAARKFAARDGEWMTMTIIAYQNHFATWVNGYQVTDFTDSRSIGKDTEKNLRLEKGPVKLESSDAATEVSFRKIRLREWPTK